MTLRLLFLALLLFSFSVFAQTNHELAVSYGRSDYAEYGDSPTMALSYARLWSNGFGARAGIHRSAKEYPDNQGDQTVGAYYAMAEYHFFQGRLFSPYAGAGVAYGVARVHLSPSNFTAEDTALSAIGVVGIDVNVTRRFAIGADVTHMKFDPNVGDRHGSALHPITFLGTIKYRF